MRIRRTSHAAKSGEARSFSNSRAFTVLLAAALAIGPVVTAVIEGEVPKAEPVITRPVSPYIDGTLSEPATCPGEIQTMDTLGDCIGEVPEQMDPNFTVEVPAAGDPIELGALANTPIDM